MATTRISRTGGCPLARIHADISAAGRGGALGRFRRTETTASGGDITA